MRPPESALILPDFRPTEHLAPGVNARYNVALAPLNKPTTAIMSLIQCPDCNSKVSDEARACPSCGRPIKESSSERAPLSSVFSLISAAALLAFVWGVSNTVATFQHWSFKLILVWGAVLAVGFIIWAGQGLPKSLRFHLIGNPTLSMVGGVAGCVIAAVALAFTLNSTLEQDKTARGQLEILKRIETDISQLQRILAPNR